MVSLLGSRDELLHVIEKAFDAETDVPRLVLLLSPT